MKKLIVLVVVALSLASCPLSETSESAPATYTVTYNSNGEGVKGVIVDTNAYASGQTVTVKDGNGMVNPGHSFSGWNTQSDGTTASYVAGDQFSISSDMTLYAIWQAKGDGTLVADPAKGRNKKEEDSHD
ncbi:MAG TPA: InlB B-repeat-containing protein [Spirochaetia bacterium]|nr:InlB B-repeat-containing protein [Spirochaetia bacterium]